MPRLVSKLARVLAFLLVFVPNAGGGQVPPKTTEAAKVSRILDDLEPGLDLETRRLAAGQLWFDLYEALSGDADGGAIRAELARQRDRVITLFGLNLEDGREREFLLDMMRPLAFLPFEASELEEDLRRLTRHPEHDVRQAAWYLMALHASGKERVLGELVEAAAHVRLSEIVDAVEAYYQSSVMVGVRRIEIASDVLHEQARKLEQTLGWCETYVPSSDRSSCKRLRGATTTLILREAGDPAERFAAASTTRERVLLARSLVLGNQDREGRYYEYILGLVNEVAESKVPYPFGFDELGPDGEWPELRWSEELSDWAASKDIPLEEAAELAVHEYPGRVAAMVPNDERGIAALCRCVESRDPFVASVAVNMLARHQVPDCVGPIITRIANSRQLVHDELMISLTIFDDARAYEAARAFAEAEGGYLPVAVEKQRLRIEKKNERTAGTDD